ncbi:MAG: hypothetical protein GF398_12455 [Chitinivibrionales bacterium]|nr:hypothetical protein [Chitinivibrionales bacterium]
MFEDISGSPGGNRYQNPQWRKAYEETQIVRKPLTGIVSGYHELPYILVAPEEENAHFATEISGKISASPKFVISPDTLGETFGDVFDAETFDENIEGRLFTFAYGNRKNLKIHSDYLTISNVDAKPQEHIKSVEDKLMSQEDISTALIFGPVFKLYPISLDRFLNEIIDREFRF